MRKRGAYFNEIDPFAAAWLRELIKAGHIAEGDVDERSIEVVQPDELHGYTQCHFFAGIGVWSYALRLAGWPDERPIWTGSCPCQPFSAAGTRGGAKDPRHLWPQFGWLIGECRPAVVIGEQVASKDGLAWLDLVHAEMEGEGYAFAAVDTCAAGVGAPHIRQRLWWAGTRLENADAGVTQLAAGQGARPDEAYGGGPHGQPPGRSDAGGLADTAGGGRAEGLQPLPRGLPERAGGDRLAAGAIGMADAVDARLQGRLPGRADAQRRDVDGHAGRGGADSGLADAAGARIRDNGRGGDAGAAGGHVGEAQQRRGFRPDTVADGGIGTDRLGDGGWPGPVDGFWADPDWLFCRDGKWRPVESGTFPLVNGSTGRVGRLRGYGNAINAIAAQVFIESLMDVIEQETGQ